jgi:hypothetical protein
VHHKPVILTSFDGGHKLPYWNSARRLKDYAHLAKFIGEGGAAPVTSYAELTELIEKFLKQPDHLADRRKNALYRECYKDDGGATARVVSSFNQMLSASR